MESQYVSIKDAFLRTIVEAHPGMLVPEQLPRGAVVALAQLVDVLPTERVRDNIEPQELAFGDYGDGRFAWILEEVDELVKPLPARGSLGLWNWEH